jgi:hypothetical protein
MRSIALALAAALASFHTGAAQTIVTMAPLTAEPCFKGQQEGFPFSRDDSLRYTWYSAHWRAFGEGGLCAKIDSMRQVFRFVWLPSDHSPVAITVEDRNKVYVMRAKQLDGTGGFVAGRLVRDTTISLDKSDWARLLLAARGSGFYGDDDVPPGLFGQGGAQWILEWAGNGAYHSADRWSPSVSGRLASFRGVGEWMMRRSGLVPDSLVARY